MNKFTLLTGFVLSVIVSAILYYAPITCPIGMDKLCHFVGFSLMSVLAIVTFVMFFGKRLLNFFLFYMLVFGGLIAGATEFYQGSVPARTCCVEDWVMNLLGITVVVACAFFVNLKQGQQIKLENVSMRNYW